MSAGSVALIGFAVMAAFGLLRRTAALNIVSLAAIAACLVMCTIGTTSTPASCPLAIAGLVGWWAGLLLLRTMLARSVSLTLLIGFAGGREGDATAQMASRLDEALGLGLVEPRGDGLHLTRRGRLIVRCVGAADRALGRTR